MRELNNLNDFGSGGYVPPDNPFEGSDIASRPNKKLPTGTLEYSLNALFPTDPENPKGDDPDTLMVDPKEWDQTEEVANQEG